jgi:hypothetical protein
MARSSISDTPFVLRATSINVTVQQGNEANGVVGHMGDALATAVLRELFGGAPEPFDLP